MHVKQVLFVDDEQNILSGLKRMLRPMRTEWKMFFVQSGSEALALMGKEPMDVVVTDMRMPGMDGAELLTQVMTKYPRTIRIILSGHSDIDSVIQTVLPAHQYLSKPCSSEQLKAVIEKAVAIKDLIEDDSVQSVINSIGSLPAVPEVYHQVVRELSGPEPSLARIGKIISQDVGMCAKLLKLVNSSFFGFCRHISSPEQAATLLGTNVIRSLILSVHIFSVFDFSRVPGFSLKDLWEHCLTTGRLAEKLGRAEGITKDMADECYIGGLLHDVGKLVLASQLPDRYNMILEKVRQENRSVHEVELEIMGTTHAEIGAYLMGIWGLPISIVEAIAFHHNPSKPVQTFNPVSAVYAANILERKYYIVNPDYFVPDFDLEYLGRMGLLDRLESWQALALKDGRTAMESDED
ncbi:response regulator [Desulfonatronovibrio hydrogenovorans]|uniref:response regulator n=1 Tax=Desulfonatronovibrio hydrogenovorans TaxID=53245 RepID=UPI00048D5DD5|nr:response regulator [Desulfonatronovibrio hydrogenovorans]